MHVELLGARGQLHRALSALHVGQFRNSGYLLVSNFWPRNFAAQDGRFPMTLAFISIEAGLWFAPDDVARFQRPTVADAVNLGIRCF